MTKRERLLEELDKAIWWAEHCGGKEGKVDVKSLRGIRDQMDLDDKNIRAIDRILNEDTVLYADQIRGVVIMRRDYFDRHFREVEQND